MLINIVVYIFEMLINLRHMKCFPSLANMDPFSLLICSAVSSFQPFQHILLHQPLTGSVIFLSSRAMDHLLPCYLIFRF